MGSPHQQRLSLRIILPIIILRKIDGQIPGEIPLIFSIQSDPVIFRMPHHKDAAAIFRHGQKKNRLVGLREHRQRAAGTNILHGNLRMTGMGGEELVIESPDQRDLAVHDLMPEQSEHLL